MDRPAGRSVNKAADSIQQRLTDYAYGLTYEQLSPQAIHAAKVRIIDTMGAVIGGFFGDACRIARDVAAQMPDSHGATVIGTRLKTMPDMAAFVNATTARYPEMTDSYHRPGAPFGHASDTIMPVLAAAEHARASGADFIAAIVLAYEIFLRICDVFHNEEAFDPTIFACIASSAAAGKLFGLSHEQLSHCISMAVVPNNILKQVRRDHLSMFKAAAAGQAGRAGVFAALLAREGMEGPHLPFEGKAGWCEHVARERFVLAAFGGRGTPYKILETLIKNRPSSGETISCILATEKVAPALKSTSAVKQISVEVNEATKKFGGTGEQRWNVDSREAADHSIPYLVAATLMDGTVTLRSYNDAHLSNPELRALMQKVEVVQNAEFTRAFQRSPQEHRTRVIVMTTGGERLVGETGGDCDDLSMPKSKTQIEEKFRGLTEDLLGAKRVNSVLEQLWRLEDVEDIAQLPPAFVLG